MPPRSRRLAQHCWRQLRAERIRRQRDTAGTEILRMLGVALSIVVLLALAGCGAEGMVPQDCIINAEERARMLGILQLSAMDSRLPNPSVLLALNLARDSSKAQQELLERIKETAVKQAKDMSSGQVALYTLALLSSCCDLRHVEAHGQSVDLLSILREKMDKEVAHWEEEGILLSTLFSVGLDAQALCVMGAGGYQSAVTILTKQLRSSQDKLSVDEQAMMALPLVCAYNRNELQDMQDLLSTTLSNVTNKFLENQDKGNGLIGNIYSTGLAMQLLLAAGKFYAPRKWDCTQPVAAITKHHLQQPMAIAQALPALMGRTYLDSASLDCSPEEPTATSLQLDPTPSQGTAAQEVGSNITVKYTITNNLSGQFFTYTTMVDVPDGSVLLVMLEQAEKSNKTIFGFKTESTFWGPMVVSIHGLAANETERTYWQFFSGSDALQEGVGTYKPHDREHIRAVFSTY
ncbi:cobalamin binding intrinsic factor [Meleagris gallopavo]|uniref:cobalamin binding intrinsic factor n=1 Tax=Meleagris gallopavo TaxID=9103 RepID=UPI00093A7F01|nr:cobalamin binding intrinsic factor [Meleagris gallopavo]